MALQILESMQGYGNVSLYLVMLLEGLSIPFPGLIVILAIGNILSPGILETFWLALSMSILYSLASFVPYTIGLNFQYRLEGKLSGKLKKVQSWFQNYGEWSICFSRFFAVGNYISYVAGMSKVNPLRYWLLTFTGIFSWSLLILLLANITSRSNGIAAILSTGCKFYYFIAAGVVLALLCLLFIKAKRILAGN